MPTTSRTPPSGTALLSTIIVVAIAYFALAIVVLHVVRADLDPVQRPTSEYAVGPYGFLMASAFLSMSVATWALIIGLSRAVSRSAWLRIGLVFMAVWAVGVLVAMSFPIDLEGAPPTASGTIHRINGPIGFLSVTIGMLLVSSGLRSDPRWRGVARIARALSLAMLSMLVVTIVSRATGVGIAGLVQRAALTALVAWFVLVGRHLVRIHGGPDRIRA